MNYEMQDSLQFDIKELSLFVKGKKIDIRNMYEEINLFDSIFSPCMSGSILIRDAVGLTDTFLFDGTELLKIQISKNSDFLQIEKTFRIYKQTNRKPNNQNSESYILHFVSEEMFISLQRKVSQLFESTYAEAAVQILQDYLNVPTEKMYGVFDNSLGVKKIVIPNLNPILALSWLAQRAIDENLFPGFLFYENINGYNFVSLSTLLKQQHIAKVNFDPKNIGTLSSQSGTNEFLGARYFEVIQQYDVLKNVVEGVYAGTFVGFDPVTKTIVKKPVSFLDNYNKIDRTNSSPNVGAIKSSIGYNMDQYDSKVVFHPFSYFQRDSNYVKENDPESINLNLDTENYVLQRKSIFTNLTNQRVKIVVPGNLGFSAGHNLFLKTPKYGIKDESSNNLDKSTYGNYLIAASRHIIRYSTHETILELVTDSSNRSDDGKIYSSTQEQMVDYT